jgi:hypothetical protein
MVCMKCLPCMLFFALLKQHAAGAAVVDARQRHATRTRGVHAGTWYMLQLPCMVLPSWRSPQVQDLGGKPKGC